MTGTRDSLILPQDLEAERALLGCMMVNREAFTAMKRDDGGWFLGAGHRDIFEALYDLRDADVAIDLITLRNHLEKAGRLEVAGGAEYLVQCAEGVPSPANAMYYARIVAEKACLRELISAANSIATDAHDPGTDASDVLNRASERVAAVTARAGGDLLLSPPPPAWLSPKEIMDDPAYAKGLALVSTSYSALDDALLGGFRVGVTILASRTGGAKSQTASNMARRMALDGESVLLFALEDSPRITTWRMHAATAHTPIGILLNGISGHGPGIDAIRDAYAVLFDLPVRLSDVRELSDIVQVIRQHALANGAVVIIDQVSKVETRELPGAATQYERVNEISERLRCVAVECGLPIVLVSQVNREAGKRDGELELHDLRDSGMLEQDAVAVLLINKPTKPPHSSEQPAPYSRLLPIKVAKNRFGPAGQTVHLLWHTGVGRIDELPSDLQEVTNGGE